VATPTPGAGKFYQPGGAEEAARLAPLEPPARQLVRPSQTVADLLAALAAAGHWPDALRVVAFGLTKREAVWWAARCVRRVPELTEGAANAPSLAACEKWAADEADASRRACYAAAEAAEFSTAAGCAAMAAFWSGGSIAPAGALTPVAAAAHLSQVSAATAAVLAAVSVRPEEARQRFEEFVALGHEVAAGTNRWAEAAPPPPVAAARPAPPPASPPPPPPPQSRQSWY
jgi:hypothetical protein